MNHPVRCLLPQPSEIHATSTWCTQDFVTVVELLESGRLPDTSRQARRR
jgi:hypothetical protein